MLSFLTKLLDTSDFTARWHCGNWTPFHGWLHIASDLAIFSAYMAIPLVLAYFVLRRRRDLPFPRVFWLFCVFIAACGTSHLMEAIIFWEPLYRVAGIVKVITAAASWLTVAALVPIVPKALALPSPKELENEIAERKRAHEALLAKNRQLIEAERLKSEFFANVSHELRTPLTLILAPIESLLSGEQEQVNDATRRTLGTVHNNAVRLLQMVTELLDYARLEAGQMESKRQAVDVTALARGVLDDFRPIAGEKGLQLEWDGGESPLIVELDQYLYERILFNLLSNAVKFTPAAGRITVRMRYQQERLRLEVEDTGIGISPEQQQSLFQRFHQLDGTATRRNEGVGLGLALVKEFAELLGGFAAVRSERNVGSTFLVVCDAPLSTQAPQEGVESTARLRPYSLRPQAASVQIPADIDPETADDEAEASVLIAEDNAEMAEYLRSLLSPPYRTIVVQNGDQALAAVRRAPPDLVLADAMMPGCDGFSLCQQLKQSPQTAAIPFVLLTALAHREAMLKGWQAGADEYLVKPFHPLELSGRIKSLLTISSQRKGAETALVDARVKLEEEVRERTEELQQANQALRREAEQRRRGDEAAARLAAIVESSDDAITAKTLDGTITSWNSGAERIYGHTAEEALGRSMSIIIPPDRREEHDEIMRRLAGGERVTNFDTVRMRRDGRLIHVSLSISPMVDEAGTIIGASTIARDVTEQRQAERLYRISQERLRFTLRAARVGTWDWNLETGEVIWSDNLEEIHGRLPGTFGGSIESVMEDLHPDDRPAVEQAVRRSLEDDERYDVEYRVLRHDGSEGWLQGRGQVTRDWNGRPVSMSGICQDITDRKRAQQELQQELAERRRAEEDLKRLNDTLEERVASRTNLLRMLNHVATAANAATDGDAVFQICLDQVCSYTGWELGHVYLYDDVRSELTPLGVWRLDEQARFQGFRDATLAAPIGLDDPLLGQAFRQGRPIWLANSEPAAAFQRWDVAAKAGLKSAMAIPVLAGDRAAAVLEFHSTDAVQPDDDLLDAMRQVAAQLGRVVERSQVRRLEEKMRHAQKLESLGVLAGGIAHDFNNLLTAVLGYTELALRQTPADSPLQELLGQVRTAALQAAELCNQMLAYSGQGRFVVEPVDLSKLLRDMGNLLSVSISKKAHVEFDLAVDLADDLARVQGDPAQLRQIVMNLMTNASDALEDKPGTITVRTGAAQLRGAHPSDLLAAENLPAGDYVFLEIADTGCGMDEETCAKMFDPFFTTKFTGRGLGMAAVLGIVRGHGGLIRVQSEPGQGTVIRVYFPGSSAVPKQQVIRAHPDRSFAWRRHILIVDDDPSVLRVTTLLLESFGFRVSQANNGHEAVEAIRRRPHEFAMVLLDLTMPEMSGHEALSEIRAIRSDLPVLLASGYREQDAVHRVPGERPTAFIQKPFEFDVLMAKMRQVLDGAAGKS